MPLSDLLKDLKESNYSIISNVHQRRDRGGRPALIINNNNFIVQDLTQSEVTIPWGCEIVWCVLTPKNLTNTSIIQKIICAAIYSKPKSKFKSKLLDHISDTFYLLSKKYSKGAYWILAGDTNEMKLDAILNLDPNMKQIVQDSTVF